MSKAKPVRLNASPAPTALNGKYIHESTRSPNSPRLTSSEPPKCSNALKLALVARWRREQLIVDQVLVLALLHERRQERHVVRLNVRSEQCPETAYSMQQQRSQAHLSFVRVREDHPCSLLVRLIEQGADGGDGRFLDAQNEVDGGLQAWDDGGAGL